MKSGKHDRKKDIKIKEENVKNDINKNKGNKKGKKILKIIVRILCVVILLYVVFIIIERQKNPGMDDILDNIEVEESTDDTRTEMVKKLEVLRKENEEIIGWLKIEGTNISYPVLQTNNNDFYLTHDYKKDYSVFGSIFLDTEYDFEKPSSNLLIYGHRDVKGGKMFEELVNYKKEDFYKEHSTIHFTTENEESEYEIIAVFLSRVYYKSEKNVFRYYYFVDAENEKEFNDYVNNSKKASIYDIDKTATYGDQLLTLSTCEYSQEDGRLAIVARKVTQ